MYMPTLSQTVLFVTLVIIGSHSLPQREAVAAGSNIIEGRQFAEAPSGIPTSVVDGFFDYKKGYKGDGGKWFAGGHEATTGVADGGAVATASPAIATLAAAASESATPPSKLKFALRQVAALSSAAPAIASDAPLQTGSADDMPPMAEAWMAWASSMGFTEEEYSRWVVPAGSHKKHGAAGPSNTAVAPVVPVPQNTAGAAAASSTATTDTTLDTTDDTESAVATAVATAAATAAAAASSSPATGGS